MSITEYKDIRSFDDVRQVFRRLLERLDALEGHTGTVRCDDDIDMKGNLVKGGPTLQTKAENTDYITKGYLSSKEAGNVLATLLQSGGTSPLNVTNLIGSSTSGLTVRVDVFANRGTAPRYPNELFAASDMDYVTWWSDGVVWRYFTGIMYDTTADITFIPPILDNRPMILSTMDAGFHFYSTNKFEHHYWNGTAWDFFPIAIDSPTFYVDKSSHRIGIGTIEPLYELHLKKEKYGVVALHVENISDHALAESEIKIVSDDGNAITAVQHGSAHTKADQVWVYATGAANKLIIGTNGMNARASFLPSGLIGFGRTDPTHRVDIKGPTGTILRIESEGTIARILLHTTHSGTTSADGGFFGMNDSQLQLWNYEDNYVVIAANDTPQLLINKTLAEFQENVKTLKNLAVVGAFGCNNATPQTPVASGGAAGPGSGTATSGGYGFVSATEMNNFITAVNAIKDLVNTIRTTLISNGQMT